MLDIAYAAFRLHGGDEARTMWLINRPLAARLVENKCFAPDLPSPAPAPLRPRAAPPVVIGWFGILRCRRSLACLDALTRSAPGQYRIEMRGRPALDAMPEFPAVVAANPDLVFEGAYRNPEDLAGIYGAVDLAWLIDRMDAGSNSDWLLPNRLYESCRHGVAPVALAGTETAAFLAKRGLGLILPSRDTAWQPEQPYSLPWLMKTWAVLAPRGTR